MSTSVSPAQLAPTDASTADSACGSTPVPRRENLADLVDTYGSTVQLPSTPWLVRLELKQPRHDVRSLSEGTRLLKRLTDIVVSVVMLVVLAPVMAVVALLVRLTSPGPVIFRQERVGLNLRRPRTDRRQRTDLVPPGNEERRTKNSDRRQESGYGQPFVLYKFRTMRNDAERNGAQFAQKGDPRVTSVGRFLRKTRLDELPQLWNVLKGEMSLVGPRPERPVFIEELSREIPDYLQRLGLKPGLTGVAQVVNGYDNDIESFRRKVAFDLLYLQNCCFRNDVKILLRTIRVVLTGSGAL
ncbi:MAG: sugar transferase [Planctomycetaceae bacterium]|nr:sugar transferase [Planctomycetaceae bacterium]